MGVHPNPVALSAYSQSQSDSVAVLWYLCDSPLASQPACHALPDYAPSPSLPPTVPVSHSWQSKVILSELGFTIYHVPNVQILVQKGLEAVLLACMRLFGSRAPAYPMPTGAVEARCMQMDATTAYHGQRSNQSGGSFLICSRYQQCGSG